MVKKFYDVTDLQTGEVMREMTVREFQEFAGAKICVSKYFSTGRIYKGRYKFELSKKQKEKKNDTEDKAYTIFNQNLYDEWNSMRALFKNIEWIRKGSETP